MNAWDSTPHATISKPYSERDSRTHRTRRGHRITCTNLITEGAIIACLRDGSYVNDPEMNHPDAKSWFRKRRDGAYNPWEHVA